MKIVVTGARGLIGWHTAARIHARNCAARFKGERPPYELVMIDRAEFQHPGRLALAVKDASAILHFAGVNRGPDDEIAGANPAIAQRLVEACRTSGSAPHIVYANSIQSRVDSVYGNSKRSAGETLASLGTRYTNIVLPHIFGECARPDYNNVTATLIDRLWRNSPPIINAGASVSLLHAGEAAEIAIGAVTEARTGELSPAGTPMQVSELWARLQLFHDDYQADVFPDLDKPFDLALFNSYRSGGYPLHYPKPIDLRIDARGVLFETAKSHGRSQSFISSTLPGRSRGDHFHLSLVERFLVVKGRATIRVRRVLTDETVSFVVSGENPVAVDMPTLHTHHIVNDGQSDLITYFWANRLFDPLNPDTYADPVMKD